MNPIEVNLLCSLIPSIVSGIGLYAISHRLIATAEGTEAIARAIQRIPDAHCNGDMKVAIEKVESSLSEQRAFLREKAVEATSKKVKLQKRSFIIF